MLLLSREFLRVPWKAGAPQITEKMKLAAAIALAELVPDDQLNEDNIMPFAFDPKVVLAVSKAVKDNIE